VLDVTVRGADEIAHVSRLLREVGDKELRRDLYRGLNRATSPLKRAVKERARATLPSRGGLAARVASSSIAVRTRGGQHPGVRLVARGKANLDRLDRGVVRHPVFGNREVWVSQQVTPGWFTEPLQEGVAPVQRELLDVLDDISRRLARG